MSSNTHDTTMSDSIRRYKGVYYTPKIWVDEVHADLERLYGKWRDDDDVVVWDCCAGSGNLTRDYPCKNLVLSTLLDSEVNILKQEQGSSAHVFQYDFLNSDHLQDLPPQTLAFLQDAAKCGKRIVFLMNPPYAASGSSPSGVKKAKAGAAISAVKGRMNSEGMGKASNDTYIQFMYEAERVATLLGFKNRTIAVICKINHFCSQTTAKFRAYWWKKHEFRYGFIFPSKEFGLTGKFPITFQIWDNGVTPPNKDIYLDIKVRK